MARIESKLLSFLAFADLVAQENLRRRRVGTMIALPSP